MKFFKLPDALNRRTEARKRKKPVLGFTLVELVIVIAVLAILSGVGVLGYSGYIEYAKRAADEELISAVNTAFAAACEENGVERMSLRIDEAKLDTSNQPAIKGILSVAGLEGDALTTFQTSFSDYFDGNETTELEAIPINDIHFANGVFIADEATLEGARTQQAIGDFNNSNYHDNIEGLVQNVEGVTSLFSMVVGANGLLEDRLSSLNSMVDVPSTVEGLKKLGITDDSSSTEIANAMVLYVAQATSAMEDTSVLIEDIMSGTLNQNRGLMELPMMIGMYSAYYNSKYASEQFKEDYSSAMESPYGVLMLLMSGDIAGDSGYTDYKDYEMREDLEGYLGALRLVDQNKASVDIKDPNAFSNDDFMALIKSVLGST